MSVDEARRLADELIDEFGIKAPPVPVDRIVRAKEIFLQYGPLDDQLSGMAFIKDGLAIIGVNALHHPNRQRFTIAHELAHHLLHRPQIEAEVHIDKGFRVMMRDNLAAAGVDLHEIEANAFAAALLMPWRFLEPALGEGGWDIDDDQQMEKLARRFRVSKTALQHRLSNKL